MPHQNGNHVHARGAVLFTFVLTSAVVVILAFFGRAYETRKSDRRLCEKVDKVVNASIAVLEDIQDPKIRDRYVNLFRQAACDPNNLP